jgi:hypothetical protein
MRASGYAKADNDYYVEPPWIVDALLDAEEIPLGTICWDPSCGGGNIPDRAYARGIQCGGSDVVDRGYGYAADFFGFERPLGDASVIISNPPFGVMERYVRHALSLVSGRVIILARLAFLESQTRASFFAETPLARVWVSRRRASMPPGGTDIKAKGGSIPFAWFVWAHGHHGPPTIGWI